MSEHRGDEVADERTRSAALDPPAPRASWAIATASVLVVAATYWLALQPGARYRPTPTVTRALAARP